MPPYGTPQSSRVPRQIGGPEAVAFPSSFPPYCSPAGAAAHSYFHPAVYCFLTPPRGIVSHNIVRILFRKLYSYAHTLLSLSRILTWSMITTSSPQSLEPLRVAGMDVSLAGPQSPAYAAAVTPLLAGLFVAPPQQAPPVKLPHSASVVVVDAAGNVASIVHTSTR